MRVSHYCAWVWRAIAIGFGHRGHLSICHLIWGLLYEGDHLGYFCEGLGVEGSCSADDYRDGANVSFPLPVGPDGLHGRVVDAFYL